MKQIIVLLFAISVLFGFQKEQMLSKDAIRQLQLKPNRIYVIDFFASWCHSCKLELPKINKIANETSKITVIGIDVDENIEDGKLFQKELKLNFTIINDNNNRIVQLFNPVGVPAVYVVKNYKIVDLIVGANDNIYHILKGYIK